MSSLRDNRVCVSRLNSLKFLQWGGARMVEEVGDGARARRWTTQMKTSRVHRSCPGRVPWLPLYRVRG